MRLSFAAAFDVVGVVVVLVVVRLVWCKLWCWLCCGGSAVVVGGGGGAFDGFAIWRGPAGWRCGPCPYCYLVSTLTLNGNENVRVNRGHSATFHSTP